MAATFKVRYKNHCTPQEQILTDGRWYLDSDCGRKLTGDADTSLNIAGSFVTEVAISGITELLSGGDFVYVKNTGSADILVTLDNSNYLILLSPDEAFASEINSSAVVKAKPVSSASILEYYGST